MSAETPGQLPIPLSDRSSSVVLPHCSGAGSAAPSISAPFKNVKNNLSTWCTNNVNKFVHKFNT